MTMKTKSTRSALISAILVLVMSLAMLAGTTYAWFTDSASSTGNTITAGKLDVELHMFNENSGAYQNITDSKLPIFGEDGLVDANENVDLLWEPGKTQVVYLAIKNAGNLALKYRVSLDVTDIKNDLNEVLSYTITRDAKAPEGKLTAWDGTNAKRVIEGVQLVSAESTAMKAGDIHYFALSVHMDEDAGSKYMEGSISFNIDVIAGQLGNHDFAEKDSFGNGYDNGAGFNPNSSKPAEIPAGGAAEDVVLDSGESGMQVSVPKDVVNSLAGVESISLNHSDAKVDDVNNIITYDNVDLLDQNGKEIDLTGNTTPIKVTLNVGNGCFADGERVDIYHDGAFVASAVVENGEISYSTVHFCRVEVGSTVADFGEDNLVIDSVADFLLFAEMVNGGNAFSGKTVVLGADIDLSNVTWTPIGNSSTAFKGIFDGNGKTVSNLVINGGSNSNIGLFGVTQNGEIKNLTVKNAIVSGRLNVGVVAGQPYTSKYTNITVCGHVEVNGMAYVGGVGGKNAYANWTNINVSVDDESYVKANSVEDGKAYRTYVGGVIGFMGEGGHVVSNVKSNIDVYGSTIDVGGITGIAHYGNTFDNVVCTGDVYITDAADASEAEEIGGIAGVWNNGGADVTIKNSKFTGKLSVNVDGVDLSDNIVTGSAYSATGTGNLIINTVWVSTADELVAALEEGKSVIFLNDIKIDSASMSNAYGKTGINVKAGQMIDGNEFTLDIKGAGGTWDSGISTTGGIIKNITITGSFRGVFINHNSDYSETVVLENVIIDGTTYTISCDQGKNQNFVANGSTFKGWTSYATTIGTATFNDCSFGEGKGYAFLRPYAPTTFVGCKFEAGYKVDPRAAVTFENCTLDGVLITAENVSKLVTSTANVTVK